MGQSSHQCFIYEGSPSRYLPGLAALLRQKLNEKYRCLYLNSPAMVAGMRSYLAAEGIDVARETGNTSLILTANQDHLQNGRFEIDRMMKTLEDALQQALDDGFKGLWATGDMTWEFGPQKDFSKLLEYEWRLEEFFHKHPALGGLCMYHADTLPRETLRRGLVAHPTIYLNETLSRINPHYLPPQAYNHQATTDPRLDHEIDSLCRAEAKS